MRAFFVRKFKFEGKSGWLNPFVGMLTGLALVLILMFGFYTYTSNSLYRDTETKEAKSYLDTISFVANYLSDKQSDLAKADAEKSASAVKKTARNVRKPTPVTPVESSEENTILGEAGDAPAENAGGGYADIPGYADTLQNLVDRMAKDDPAVVKIRIGSVRMGAVNGQLIAENGKKNVKGPMMGGEASQNLSMDAKSTFKQTRSGDVAVKVMTKKNPDASYHIVLKGFRKYKSGQNYDIGLVTRRDTWNFPFLPQLFPFLGIFALAGIFAFLGARFLKGGALVIQIVALFLVFSFGSLFLIFNMAQGDYLKNNDRLTATYTRNLEQATAALQTVSSNSMTAEGLAPAIAAFNLDVYSEAVDNFSVLSVNPVKVANDEAFIKKGITNNNALNTVGWLLGFLLGGGALWGLAKSRGFEKFLNNLYNFSTAYLFILPSILGMLLLVFVPIVFTLIISFTNLPATFKELNLSRHLVGFQNFAQILGAFDIGNPNNFYNTFFFTIFYTIAAVVIQAGLGVTIAVILNDKKLQLKGFYQVVFMLPWIIPTYISGLLWNNFFKGDGVMNQLFRVFGAKQFEFFNDPVWSFFIVSFVSAWYAFPFIMLVTLSALQTVPEAIYEAAAIEGAGWWTTLFQIVLPMIRPTVLPSLLLSSIWTFNNFNLVYLVTGQYGRPDILVTRIYDFARPTDLSYGYAAAYSALVFIVLLFYIYIFARSTNLTEKSY